MSLKKSKKRQEAPLEKINFLDKVNTTKGLIITAGLISVFLLFIFKPFVFEGLSPGGEDVVGSIGQTNLYTQWQDETGEKALWNPNIFCGMPTYPRITPVLINFDSLISVLSQLTYWAFFYFLAGGLGIYLFLVLRKCPWYIACLMALVFILLPDWIAQLGAGHNAKIRALMVLPVLLASFEFFYQKKNWLGTGIFALVFSWMVRTQHFQIIFYAILLLFFLYIVPYIKLWADKNYKVAANLSAKFVFAIVLTIITSAQPFLTIKEYTPYSTRGGNALSFTENDEAIKKTSGVSFDYATQWSLAPSEMLDFFIARFHGGYSQEIYEGDNYPQLKGRSIPGYWGEKPFNGNFSFIGILIICFAIFGLLQNRKDKFIIATAVFVVFTLLLSFGRHFPQLYKLFFYYMPYFSKFRAPSMITNATFVGLIILAAAGLKSLFVEIKESDFKKVFYLFGSAIGFSILLFIIKDSFALSTLRESQTYDANTIGILKGIRLEYLTADLMRMIIILLLATGFVIGFLRKKIKLEITVGLISLLVLAEVFVVADLSFEKVQMHDREKMKQQMFNETQISQYLEKQDDSYRAVMLGRAFTGNHYAYYYPTINGYSAIKLQLIQDLIEHSIFKARTKDGINWNVIKMLGGKYIIANGALNEEFLNLAAVDKKRNESLYVNNDVLPKAWFVKGIKHFNSEEEIVNYMNSAEFNPADECLATAVNIKTDSLSAEGSIQIVDKNPNVITLKTNTEEEQFLVLSEVYYPEGWRAFIGEEELKIHQVNHILRGMNIPAGENILRVEFSPPTYNTALILSKVGNGIVLLLILVSLFLNYYKKDSQ